MTDNGDKQSPSWPEMNDTEFVEALRAEGNSPTMRAMLELEERQQQGFDLQSHDPALAEKLDEIQRQQRDAIAEILQPFVESYNNKFGSLLGEKASGLFNNVADVKVPNVDLSQFATQFKMPQNIDLEAMFPTHAALTADHGSFAHPVDELLYTDPTVRLAQAVEVQHEQTIDVMSQMNARLVAIEGHVGDTADASVVGLEFHEQDQAVTTTQFEALQAAQKRSDRIARISVVVAAVAVLVAICIAIFN